MFFMITTVIQYLTFQNADNTALVTHVIYLSHLHSLAALQLHNKHFRVCYNSLMSTE